MIEVIGLRVGLEIGLHGEPAVLVGVDPVDSLSLKSVPLTQAEWDGLIVAAGGTSKTLSHSHDHQDASGQPAAEVGTDLVLVGDVEYQVPVDDWDRTATRFTETMNTRATLPAGAAPNPASGSALAFFLVRFVSAPAATRSLFTISDGTTSCTVNVTSTPRIRTICAGDTVDGGGDVVSAGVMPMFVQYNDAASRFGVYTPYWKITGDYSADVVDGNKGIGRLGTIVAPIEVMLDAFFAGTHAEWTETLIRSVLISMGWPANWSAA